MTKIKNTKKGMAKKTLSISLVAAMLATSNVPVWATEFGDGSDTVVEFSSGAEEAAPAVEETTVPVAEELTSETPVLEDTDVVSEASIMQAMSGTITVGDKAFYSTTVTPDYSGIQYDKQYTLQYAWQILDRNADETVAANWKVLSGYADYKKPNFTIPSSRYNGKDWIGRKIRVIAYTTDNNQFLTDSTQLAANGKASNPITVAAMPLDQDKIVVTLTSDTVTYTNGTAVTNAPTAVAYKEGNVTVVPFEPEDYEVTYQNNTEVGTAQVVVTLKETSGYTGTGMKDFSIKGTTTTGWTVQLPENEKDKTYTYTGGDITPTGIKVIDSNTKQPIDSKYYKVLPLTGKTVGNEYKVRVIGVDGYAGYDMLSAGTVSIAPKSVENLVVEIDTNDYTKSKVYDYDIDPSKPLTEGDYTIEGVNVGVPNVDAFLKITGKGNYKGTKTVDYTANSDISKNKAFKDAIADAAAVWNKTATFNGKSQTPIERGWKLGELYLNKDFTAEVTEGGTNAGTLTVVFKGIGDYTGTYPSYDFKIEPIALAIGSDKFAFNWGSLTYDPSKGEVPAPITTAYTEKYKADMLEPTIKIKSSDYVLVKGKDYDYDLAPTEAGIKLTLKEAGSTVKNARVAANAADAAKTHSYLLETKNIADADVTVSEVPVQAFTGEEVRPEVSLTYKGITYVSEAQMKKLLEGTTAPDSIKEKYKTFGSAGLTVTYENNIKIGENTASVKISGNAAKAAVTSTLMYHGTKTVKFTIGDATLENGSIVNSVDKKTDLPSVAYNKEQAESKDGIILPAAKYFVLDKNGNRVDPKYYTVTYSDNKAVGTATITVTGKNGYSGVLTNTYKIAQKSLPTSDLTITANDGIDYTGSEITLVKDRDFTVTGALADLTLDTDYTLKYENNINAGEAKVIVQGINNYFGEFVRTFKINPVVISSNDIEVGDSGYAGGKAVEPKIAIKVPGTGNVLKEGTDYTVKYSPAAYNVGDTVTINITYNANAKIAPVNVNAASATTKTVKVTAKDLKNVTISEIADQEETGEQIKPAITVKNGDVTLTEGKDFEVVYGTNTAVGEGTVTIKALASNKNYVGEQTAKFNITKKKAEVGQALIKTVNVTGNTAEVVLEGTVEGAEGYDYVIATEEDYQNGRVDISKNQLATSTDFQYVQEGTYYAYCHAWKRDPETKKKVFGEWSKLKKFEVKATTSSVPEITDVKVSGNTVTVTYTECEGATGYDVVLGTQKKKVNGENRPVNYGTLVKKNIKEGVVTATFTNVPKGTYYAGLHAFNRTSENCKKVFSPWSNVKTVTVK